VNTLFLSWIQLLLVSWFLCSIIVTTPYHRTPWLWLESGSLPTAKQKTLVKEGFAESKLKNSRKEKTLSK
jgi:hypothetical protein